MTARADPSGDANALARRLDALLPQTQCTRCGYPDCGSYAQAIASEGSPINRCPPGGEAGVQRLAALTGQPVTTLDAEHGVEGPRALAVIDEAWCIGCTLCLDACPVDAIVGASKQMHTVVDAQCTGCELCVPVCPVDCISLQNASGALTGWAAWSAAQAQEARARYDFHRFRYTRQAQEHHQRLTERGREALGQASSQATPRSRVEAALERARVRRDT